MGWKGLLLRGTREQLFICQNWPSLHPRGCQILYIIDYDVSIIDYEPIALCKFGQVGLRLAT